MSMSEGRPVYCTYYDDGCTYSGAPRGVGCKSYADAPPMRNRSRSGTVFLEDMDRWREGAPVFLLLGDHAIKVSLAAMLGYWQEGKVMKWHNGQWVAASDPAACSMTEMGWK